MVQQERQTIHRITSRSNLRVKGLLEKRDNYYFFEGEKLVEDILRKRMKVNILVIHETKEKQLSISAGNVKETWYVNDSVLKKLSSLKETPDFIAVLELQEKHIDFRRVKVIIALDSIQDPANAGTVFRCAAAFGMDAVVFCGACVKPTNPKFLRAAQNAFFETQFQHFETIEELVGKAEKAGLNIYLTSSHHIPGAVGTLEPAEVRFPCLVLFGNEGQGLPGEYFRRYPALRVSQTDKVESLNIGVSACIIMHELRKLLLPTPRSGAVAQKE
ncbi:MAG: methyltransferase, TrmH family [Acidobacteriota bacterium]|nr:methyltransferase, TrmH family [Acidobacteriota bacterium]